MKVNDLDFAGFDGVFHLAGQPGVRSFGEVFPLYVRGDVLASQRVFGLHAVALRYFTVYGPRQRPDMAFARVVDALARDEPFEVFGDGTQSRSFTYVADVVDATIRAIEATPGIYNVGGGEEATLRKALDLLEELSGRTLRVTYGPPQTGDMRRTKADTTKIERELGWRASTALRAGLAEHWEWCSARVGTA